MSDEYVTLIPKDDGSTYNILVVEDREVDQMIAVHVLEQLNCSVDLAKDGNQALKLFNKFSKGILLL